MHADESTNMSAIRVLCAGGRSVPRTFSPTKPNKGSISIPSVKDRKSEPDKQSQTDAELPIANRSQTAQNSYHISPTFNNTPDRHAASCTQNTRTSNSITGRSARARPHDDAPLGSVDQPGLREQRLRRTRKAEKSTERQQRVVCARQQRGPGRHRPSLPASSTKLSRTGPTCYSCRCWRRRCCWRGLFSFGMRRLRRRRRGVHADVHHQQSRSQEGGDMGGGYPSKSIAAAAAFCNTSLSFSSLGRSRPIIPPRRSCRRHLPSWRHLSSSSCCGAIVTAGNSTAAAAAAVLADREASDAFRGGAPSPRKHESCRVGSSNSGTIHIAAAACNNAVDGERTAPSTG